MVTDAYDFTGFADILYAKSLYDLICDFRLHQDVHIHKIIQIPPADFNLIAVVFPFAHNGYAAVTEIHMIRCYIKCVWELTKSLNFHITTTNIF